MRRLHYLLSIIVLSILPPTNALTGSGEFYVVFPQNKTYDRISTLPVIIGVRNAPPVFGIGGTLQWHVSCSNASLLGTGGRIDAQTGPSLTSYYLIDFSTRRNQYGDQINATSDECTLSWSYGFTYCVDHIISNWGQDGSVNFTLQTGAGSPANSIKSYQGCAEPGVALNVKNSGDPACGIPPTEDAFPSPKPCDLDVKGVASSLAAALVSPTVRVVSTLSTTLTQAIVTMDTAPTKSPSSASVGNNRQAKNPSTYLTFCAWSLIVALFVAIMSPMIWFVV